MATFIVAFIVFAVLFAGMAVGVILSNKPLKGSCGGLNALGLKQGCEICGGEQSKCDEENQRPGGNSGAARLSRNALDI